jgi:hypothetical protein
VALGDPIDVNYHRSGVRLIADSVDDATDSSGSQD